MRILDLTLLKFIQFKQGRAAKPKYRLHILPSGVMLMFAIVGGLETAEEAYKWDGIRWLSELDYQKDDL